MTEQSGSVPEKSGLRRTASLVGGGLGCLALLVAVPLMAVLALGVFLGDPTFWIAMAALFVAVAAYKASKRGR